MSKKSKAPVPPFDLEGFSTRFRSESDRACGVLGGAMVDARLKSLFERRFAANRVELLNDFGPLSTFSARAKVANALGWIDNDTLHDLDKIRDIRNDFAHNFNHQYSFTDPGIAGPCRALRSPESFIEGASMGLKDKSHGVSLASRAIEAMLDTMRSPRSRFELAVEFLSQHIDGISGAAHSYQGEAFLDEVRSVGQGMRIGGAISLKREGA